MHSAKFDNEKVTDRIRQAVMRHHITHPVVNDSEMVIWRNYAVRSWPTLVLIDYERARDGLYHQSKAMVLSHDMYSAARVYEVAPGAFEEVVSDQLIDGNMFGLTDRKGAPSGQMADLKAVWDEHKNRGSKL